MNQQKQSNYKESESLTLVIWLADHESVLRVVGLLPVALGEGSILSFSPRISLRGGRFSFYFSSSNWKDSRNATFSLNLHTSMGSILLLWLLLFLIYGCFTPLSCTIMKLSLIFGNIFMEFFFSEFLKWFTISAAYEGFMLNFSQNTLFTLS